MVKEQISSQMVTDTLANIKMANLTEKELILGRMEVNMKDFLNMDLNMVKAPGAKVKMISKATNILGNMTMTKRMAMVNSYGPLGIYTREIT